MNKCCIKKDPKIAVVVPVYNLDRYLEECLDSLLQQSYSNYVVFAVDDGSVDRSGEILDQYAKKYKHLKVTHQKNGGAASARNTALDEIERDGSFDGICFVDADDRVKDDFISTYAELSLKYNADYVVTAWDMFDRGGISKVPRSSIAPHDDKLMNGNECFEHFLRFGTWNGIKSKTYSLFCLNVYFSSETVIGLRFNTSLKRTEDQDYRVRAMARVTRGLACSKVTYLYRLRASSLSHHDNDFMDDVQFPLSLLNDISNFPDSGVLAVEQLLLKGWWRCVCLSVVDRTFSSKKEKFDNAFEAIKRRDFKNPLAKKFKVKFILYSLGEGALKIYVSFRKIKRLHDMTLAYP